MQQRLAEVYAKIPDIPCRGLCHGSCGPVPATHSEIAAIEKTTFVPWGVTADSTCSMLAAGRCSVYADRPLLCRLWGVVPSMPCLWGCKPDRWLTDKEAAELLAEMASVGGGYDLACLTGIS